MGTNFSTSETKHAAVTPSRRKKRSSRGSTSSRRSSNSLPIRKRLTRKSFTSTFPSFRAARSRSMAAILLTFLADYVIF